MVLDGILTTPRVRVFFFFTGKKSPVKKPRLSDVSLGDTGFGLLSQGADPCVRE